ncbi:azurin/glucose/arabinose dehydrogenase [Lewinella marina]|uniref:Auracyanin family protein n=1 Tax=Neolewinella marina TaxID=438751 RepID=A0A2G0CFS0_9BACT|nr:plastocyanin/azurin family copper-binding protein [Neolewinella marina]NJB85476.1 azurin/glucose/arabinose dehydrogenase [Neolewinella marina]PHK98834.1 auracyanin family protein [Neolewinella marina]
MRPLFLVCCLALSALLLAQQESDFYQLEAVNIPEEIKLEVGGMDFLPDGKLAVTTRRGEVWIIANPTGEATYSLFARGLHEPLGLSARDGAIYVAQRGEVTKLTDRDGDGTADVYETVYDMPLTGNYHEYHYGPLFQPDGSFLTTRNVGWEGKGVSKSPFRGWMMQYNSANGKLIPYAAGMRSPAGFGTNLEGEVFVAENQGDWIGSGRITHLRKGDFAGHPASLRWAGEPGSDVNLKESDLNDDFQTMYQARKELGNVKLPAVWFPHGILGISTAAILADNTEGAFGPFAGHLLVSDQGQSKIMRVALEKVDGEYQGVVFPFREGFSSGLLRLNFGPDKALYAGQTARGWAATGGKEFALERLKWTGKVPFEMYAVRATEDGFSIEFTKPVAAATVRPSSFNIQNFTYRYHHNYGSPVVDIQANPVTAAELQPDGKTVRVKVDGFRPGYIYEIKLARLRGAAGDRLLHDFGYYTLNAIPGGGSGSAAATTDLADAESSAKRPMEMPADWNGKFDEEIVLESALGMKFKQQYLTARPGARIKFTFRNPDDMEHNFVLTSGKMGDRVGQAALALGLQGAAMDYIPDIPEVLVHTELVAPETEDTIYFTAPTKPGTYEYVCTVPGHYQVMRGVLVVKESASR